MSDIISDKNIKARKNYYCDASLALIQSMVYPDDFEPKEVEIMRPAFDANWKILKGEIYNRQVNKLTGDLSTFKSRPEILPIYLKYNMDDH